MVEQSDYTIKREIEDVTLEQQTVERLRKEIRKDMIDEGKIELNEDEVEERLEERLLEMVRQRTLNKQGENRLHNDISFSLETN